jgi:hypothetical protein
MLELQAQTPWADVVDSWRQSTKRATPEVADQCVALER